MEISLDVTPEEARDAIMRYFMATHVNVDFTSIKVFKPLTYPDAIGYLAQWKIPGSVMTVGEEIPFRKEDGVVKIIKDHLGELR